MSITEPAISLDEVDRYDRARFFGNAINSAHSRALLRKFTLGTRKIYGDLTTDSITSPTALYIFVAGKYRHVLTRRNFPELVRWKGDRLHTWHKITAIRYNEVYRTLNILVDGFPGYNWFYLPKKYYSEMKIQVGDLVSMHKMSNGRYAVSNYVQSYNNALYDSIMKVFNKE